MPDYTIKSVMLKSFKKDKTLYLDKDYVVIEDGYILNSRELFRKYNVKNVHDLIIHLYKSNGDTFMNEFRGSFGGGY